jgi:hypothetical protein
MRINLTSLDRVNKVEKKLRRLLRERCRLEVSQSRVRDVLARMLGYEDRAELKKVTERHDLPPSTFDELLEPAELKERLAFQSRALVAELGVGDDHAAEIVAHLRATAHPAGPHRLFGPSSVPPPFQIEYRGHDRYGPLGIAQTPEEAEWKADPASSDWARDFVRAFAEAQRTGREGVRDEDAQIPQREGIFLMNNSNDGPKWLTGDDLAPSLRGMHWREEDTSSWTLANAFASGSAFGLTQMLVSLMDNAGHVGAMWEGRAVALFTGVLGALVWKRDAGLVTLNASLIRDHLSFGKITELADPKKEPHLPAPIRVSIEAYLNSLPGFQKDKGANQCQTTLDQHGYLQMQFTKILGTVAADGYIVTPSAGTKDGKPKRPVWVITLPLPGEAVSPSMHDFAAFGDRLRVIGACACVRVLDPEQAEEVVASGIGGKYQARYSKVAGSTVTPLQGDRANRPAERPSEWMIANKVGLKNGIVDQESAGKAFRDQLGDTYVGLVKLSVHVQALAVMFNMARTHHKATQSFKEDLTAIWILDREHAVERTRQLIAPHLADGDFTDQIERIMGQHAYINTAMIRLFDEAKSTVGVFAISEIRWLKSVDRTLYYSLQNLGRHAYFLEGAGARGHFDAEKISKRPLVDPYFDKVVEGLQNYAREHSMLDLEVSRTSLEIS